MNILFVSTTPLQYSSSANIRNLGLIKGLVELGHQVSICTAKPEESSRFYDESLLNISFKKIYYIEISKLHSSFTSKSSKSNSLVSRLKSKVYNTVLLFSVYDPRKNVVSMLKNNLIDESFDLIISSSDPKSAHLLAEKLIDNNRNIADKWVQYWGDPFTNDINKKSLIPNKVIQKEEERILSKADIAYYVSPFTLSKQLELFPKLKEKFRFLPVPYLEAISESNQSNYSNEEFTVGYFGDYYSYDRNIMPLYQASNSNEFKLKIVGNSNIQLQESTKVKVSKRIKYDLVKEKEAKCDLLVCVCNKTGTQIPGKIYHYAATNKPILIVLDGENKKEMRSYFESFDRYVLCDNNPDSITQAINSIKNTNKEYTPSPFFDPVNVAKKFIEIYNDVK